MAAARVVSREEGDATAKVFDQNGTFVRQWGAIGNGDGEFSLYSTVVAPFQNITFYCTMLAVDKNGQVYVCDPGNARVQVFEKAFWKGGLAKCY